MSDQFISLTAWIVVICQLTLRRMARWQALPSPEHLGFYQACANYCRRHSRLCAALNLLPGWMKVWLLDQALAKGAAQHFVLRKQAIGAQLDEVVAKGTRQLVVIGGGFDPLAIAVARQHPHMQCFEIDTPGMHRHKLAVVSAYYGALPANFHAIPADLCRQSLYDTLLADKSFAPDRPTLFVAEGLTMYLKESDIMRLFADIKRLCTVPSTFLFTVIGSHRDVRNGWAKRLRDRLLSSNEETFSWSMPEKDMAGFLIKQQFMPQYTISYAELQRPWRDDEELAMLSQENGEYLACAVCTDGIVNQIAS